MRILVCPDKFKGSLSAREASDAIADGVRKVHPDAEIDLLPMADGGEGTAQLFHDEMDGVWIEALSEDALGRKIPAKYTWIETQNLAVLDMSEASGLWRISARDRDLLRSSTRGTGLLIKHALSRGAQKMLIGLGGSATNDGGVGLAAALGWKFQNDCGRDIVPLPFHFREIAKIVAPSSRVSCEFIGLCDVTNPLLGERGATRMYGPQKGAAPVIIETLESGLSHLAQCCERDLKNSFQNHPGAGAAGGLGFGLLTFCNATLQSGFQTISEMLGLTKKVARADLVITGEGKMDAQTSHGKAPGEIAKLARKHGVPVIAVAGAIVDKPEGFDAFSAIMDEALTEHEAMTHAASLLSKASVRALHAVKIL